MADTKNAKKKASLLYPGSCFLRINCRISDKMLFILASSNLFFFSLIAAINSVLYCCNKP